MALARAHPQMAGLLLLGAAIRLAFMIGYWPAFFVVPDGKAYVTAATSGQLDPGFPFGYSAFLAVFRPFGSHALVSAAQHVIGLGLAVLVYAFLRRRGLRRWLAALAAAPLVLDAWQLSLEHYIMSDLLFTALLVGGLITLLWTDRPTAWQCVVGGGLLASAALTRTVGVPVLLLALLYLAVRRAGWRRSGAFALAVAVPVVAYMLVYQAQHGVFALGEGNARRYYGRAAQIADCDHLALTERERLLCPTEPLGQRRAPDEYGLFDDSPAAQFSDDDPAFAGFVDKVFQAQPADLVVAWVKDFSYFFQVSSPSVRHECLSRLWVPTRGVSAPLEWCYPHLASTDGFSAELPEGPSSGNPVATLVRMYTDGARVHPWILVGLLIVGALGVLAARRGGDRATGQRIVLLFASGVALLVASVVGAMYDARYTIPVQPLFFLGAALAVDQITRCRSAAAIGDDGQSRRQAAQLSSAS
jgi:hypothetical protein